MQHRQLIWDQYRYFLKGPTPIEITDVLTQGSAPFKADEIFGKGEWKVQKGLNGSNPSGKWKIARNGALAGKIGFDGPTLLWYTQPIVGDHMIQFQAATVPPFDHDINCCWAGSGNYQTTSSAVIGGIGGWSPKIYSGIESRNGTTTYVETGHLIPARIYEIAGGQVTLNGQTVNFLFVGSRLVTQTFPDLKARKKAYVGLSTWQSHIQIFAYRVCNIRPISP